MGQKRISKNSNGESSSSSGRNNKAGAQAGKSMFLIDGISPIQPLPALIAGKTQQTMSRGDNGRGRQRSMDIKGLILELIEEIYPPLYCPECYEISSSRSEADNHVKTYHQGSKIFACVSPACKQSYSSRAGLRYHLEHGHTVTALNDKGISINKRTNRLSASNNTKSSTITAPTLQHDANNNKYNLTTELQQKLDAQYPLLTCPACQVDFVKKTHVIKHLVDEHKGEEPYKCIVDDCKRTKAYATREGLLYHLANYHE